MSRNVRQLNIRLSDKMIKAIDVALEIGVANNRSDFIRAAISEKLETLSIFKRILNDILE